jgi:hypothetical protein
VLKLIIQLYLQLIIHHRAQCRYWLIPASTCTSGLTYHNHYTYLWLYSAVCAPEDGCKWHSKHVEPLYRGIMNTYKSMSISLDFQSNIYIAKMYGTMNIKKYIFTYCMVLGINRYYFPMEHYIIVFYNGT